MSYEDEKFKQLFASLIKYSEDEEEYIRQVSKNIVFLLGNRRGNLEDLDSDKVEDMTSRFTGIISDIYHDYIERSESTESICDDIEYCGSGFYSIAFRIGDNVIKLSKTEQKERPSRLDSQYQIPVFYSEDFDIADRVHFGLKVTPLVDTKDITYEDTRTSYRNIRDLGFIWNDPKEDNIGRIINVDGCKVDGKRYTSPRKYNKGDLVILDLQDIAYVGPETSDVILDEISMMSYNTNVYKFETEIIEEKKAAKASEGTGFGGKR